MTALNSKAVTVAFGVLAAGVVVFWLTRKASESVATGAAAVGDLVNPTSGGNLINRGVTAIGDALDDAQDNDSFTVGGWVYDLFHPEFDPNAPITEEDQRLKREFSKETVG